MGSRASVARPTAREMSGVALEGGEPSSSAALRLRALLMLGRPRTCVPGLLAFALGYGYTGAPVSGRMVLGALLALSIGLSANMHNAATDLHEDSLNLPGRRVLLATVGYETLIRSCRALGVFMFAGAAMLGWYFALFMTLALIGLHQYSAPPIRSKGRPLIGLWVFAQAVVFPFLFGWTTEPGRMLETLVASAVAPLGWTTPPPSPEAWQSFRYLGMWAFLTVWFMAKGMFKNVPDFDGDRAAGVGTSATVCTSRRRAALGATAATISAYLSLALLVGLHLEKTRILFALLWLLPVTANCVRLVRAEDGASGNRVLKTDMLISTGFMASLLLLVAPTVESAGVATAGALILVGTDLLGLDSRRQVDVSGYEMRSTPGERASSHDT
jgi:4-hydroxybenzoate polyprenyltransferase